MMPSFVSHTAVPLALGIGLGEKRVPRKVLIAGIAASMLPDADVIFFRFGATYDSIWSHRGAVHSLGFALFGGLLAALWLRRSAPPAATFAFVALSMFSHGLLDMLTNGGHGVAILWPITDHRYFFDWRPIQVSPLDPRRLVGRTASIIRTELLWIWLPGATLAVSLRTAFERLRVFLKAPPA